MLWLPFRLGGVRRSGVFIYLRCLHQSSPIRPMAGGCAAWNPPVSGESMCILFYQDLSPSLQRCRRFDRRRHSSQLCSVVVAVYVGMLLSTPPMSMVWFFCTISVIVLPGRPPAVRRSSNRKCLCPFSCAVSLRNACLQMLSFASVCSCPCVPGCLPPWLGSKTCYGCGRLRGRGGPSSTRRTTFRSRMPTCYHWDLLTSCGRVGGPQLSTSKKWSRPATTA